MMGDDDARTILAACFQPRATSADLLAVDSAILKGERTGSIDAYNRELIRVIHGLLGTNGHTAGGRKT